ncbi:hypothetical protein [Nocardia sp. NBC_01009]|uniref:hypothetical protein n=1 Tax=Nocardia sp. NBC_01009 TaxID=2975996 RepID=UPI003864312C|nr:hypothetical protein OHA42_24935 [Nocardia sp. NBC_01009]
MTTRPIADDEMRRKASAPQPISARKPVSGTVPAAGMRIAAGHHCCRPQGAEPDLNDLTARAILAAEHTLPCDRWLAAAAFMSADLDDD